MDRRDFLTGALAAGAASVLPAAPMAQAAVKPILWGDGAHDDTVALRALFAGEPVDVRCAGVTVAEDGSIFIRGALFRVSGVIDVWRRGQVLRSFQDARFKLHNALYAVSIEDDRTQIGQLRTGAARVAA